MHNPTIALEEHFWTPTLRDAIIEQSDDPSLTFFPKEDTARRLGDLTDERIRDMDAAGVDLAVLSAIPPGPQTLPAADSIRHCRESNDALAEAIALRPDRLAGFAALPMPDPEAAVAELHRTVEELGFLGALLVPRIGSELIDRPRFHPVFAAAAELGVPLYIHPQAPPPEVREAYFSGFSEAVEIVFATGAWGWHDYAGIGALRLMLAGTFDRHPNLQIILGHWGEMVTSFIDRTDAFSDFTGLDRRLAEYVAENVYVTGSGINSERMLLATIATVGVDRIMFSCDYPFQHRPDGATRALIENAPISAADKAKICFGNAVGLLGLTPPSVAS